MSSGSCRPSRSRTRGISYTQYFVHTRSICRQQTSISRNPQTARKTMLVHPFGSLVLAIGLAGALLTGTASGAPASCPGSKCGQVQATNALRVKVSSMLGQHGMTWDASITCASGGVSSGPTISQPASASAGPFAMPTYVPHLLWRCSWTGNGAGSATVKFGRVKPWHSKVVLAAGATT